MLQLLFEGEKLRDFVKKCPVLLFSVQAERQHNIFIDCKVWNQIVVLENKTDSLAAENGELLCGHRFEMVLLYRNAAGGRRVQSAQQVEQS